MEIRSNVQRDIIPLLLGLADGRIVRHCARQTRSKASASCPVLFVKGEGMRPVSLVIDPDTMVDPASQRYDMANATMEERYSDYRMVDGVRWRSRRKCGGTAMPLMERVVRTIEFNGRWTLPSSRSPAEFRSLSRCA